MIPFLLMSVNIALPAIGSEFSIDAVVLGWVATAYLLAASMFLLPFGKIADIHGRKRIFTMGFAVFTAFSFLAAFSWSSPLLIFFRFIQGVGGAMIFSTGLAIISAVTPPEERGRYIGTTIAMVYFGQAVGPYVGGLFTEYFGWRSIFLIPIPVCLLVIILLKWKLKEEWLEAGGERVNYVSTILFSLSLLFLMFGLSVVPDIQSVWLIAAGLLLIVYFFYRERRTINPLINLEMFSGNRVFTFSNIAAFINYSATYGVIFLISLYLQYIHLLTPHTAGLVLMSKAVMQGFFAPLAGSLSDRGEPRLYATAGMALNALGLFMLAFLDHQTSLAYVLISLVILGLGLGLFVSPNTSLIMGSLDRKYYGVSSAMIATMRLTGQVLSMAIVMFIFALAIGKVEITPAYYDAFLQGSQISFIIFGLLSCIGIYLSVARGTQQRA